VIFGIGTDIVAVARLADLLARRGDAIARRILAPDEREAFAASRDPARFLAKRFAAKEAFGKALGTGVAVPATLHAVRVGHEPAGRPIYTYSQALADYLVERGLRAHLSISDEADQVIAFAVIETP
jgi:holo-[acyl-carrier protein] synthase